MKDGFVMVIMIALDQKMRLTVLLVSELSDFIIELIQEENAGALV